MAIENIIAQLDAEIGRLKQVRDLLSSTGKVDATLSSVKGRPGRKPKAISAKPKAGAKRVLSAEARKAIADAQRRRWAAQKARKS